MNVKVRIGVVAALVVALAACTPPPYRVTNMGVSGSNMVVTCKQSGNPIQRAVLLPSSRARSVHLGDVCPS